jgi:AAA+ ATPase superfamily predicted ATPase
MAQKKDESNTADPAQACKKTMNIVGRKKEIETVRSHIRRRDSLHIHGPEGVGKSALIDYIYRKWDEIGVSPTPIYCRNSSTLREILLTIAKYLMQHGEKLISIDKYGRGKPVSRFADLRTLSTRYFRNMVFPRSRNGDFCIILDHFEYVTPRIHSFLSALHGCSSVITASRQSWELSDFNSFSGSIALWLVPKLRIGNLDKKDSFTLIETLYRTVNIKVADEHQAFNAIYEVSQGNPRMIKNIFQKAAVSKYLHDGKLNLIVIDCRMDEVSMT